MYIIRENLNPPVIPQVTPYYFSKYPEKLRNMLNPFYLYHPLFHPIFCRFNPTVAINFKLRLVNNVLLVFLSFSSASLPAVALSYEISPSSDDSSYGKSQLNVDVYMYTPVCIYVYVCVYIRVFMFIKHRHSHEGKLLASRSRSGFLPPSPKDIRLPPPVPG